MQCFQECDSIVPWKCCEILRQNCTAKTYMYGRTGERCFTKTFDDISTLACFGRKDWGSFRTKPSSGMSPGKCLRISMPPKLLNFMCNSNLFLNGFVIWKLSLYNYCWLNCLFSFFLDTLFQAVSLYDYLCTWLHCSYWHFSILSPSWFWCIPFNISFFISPI